MINVLRIPVPADLLKKMTNEERTFLLLMGHAENQISTMYKVLRFSSNFESENKTAQLTSSNQTQVILRLLIGMIYEAWIKLVNDRFLKRSNISIKMTEKGEAAVAELRAHFSTSALLGKIRNSFAFHYPDDQYMTQAFKLASEDEALKGEWNWYLSGARTNTSYFVSELVFLHAIMKAAEVSTLQEAQDKLMQEVLKVHGLLCDLFDDIGNRFMEKYFPKPLDGFRVPAITDAPSLYEFALPFYASVPEADSPFQKAIVSDIDRADRTRKKHNI
jgi:hypothetical protein